MGVELNETDTMVRVGGREGVREGGREGERKTAYLRPEEGVRQTTSLNKQLNFPRVVAV